MKLIDVINIAGLMMNGGEDSMELAVRKIVQPRFITTLAPTPWSSANEHPDIALERLMGMIDTTLDAIEREFGTSHAILVGRSYGAFMALLAATRMEFRRIFRVVLLEGPLHPDVEVRPPFLLPPLRTCAVHYHARPALAREALKHLETLGTERLIIVQGTARDDVVPNAAQILPGRFNGRLVCLPTDIGHKSGGMKTLLPDGYRNHLFWSDAKMAMICDAIEEVRMEDASVSRELIAQLGDGPVVDKENSQTNEY